MNLANLNERQQPLPEGALIDSFVIRRVLGRGGFGVTYLATEFAPAFSDASQSALRDVAIKEYFPQGLAERAEGSRVVPAGLDGSEPVFFNVMKTFVREAQALAQIDHPNVVRILRVLESHGTAYFSMPYLGGTSLRGLLRSTGRLNAADIGRLVFPILDGLEAVHKKGIIHRDLKPDNIMVASEERAQRPILIDFGAARLDGIDQALQQTRLSDVVAYTPGYAPLEQYAAAGRENRHGAFTDIYGVAAVLFHCITGRAPPEAITRLIETQAGRADPMLRLTDDPDARASYPLRLLHAVHEGLHIAAERRSATVAEFRNLIGRMLEFDDSTQLTDDGMRPDLHPAASSFRTTSDSVPTFGATRPIVATTPIPPEEARSPAPTIRWLTVLPWAVAILGVLAAAIAGLIFRPHHKEQVDPTGPSMPSLAATVRSGGNSHGSEVADAPSPTTNQVSDPLPPSTPTEVEGSPDITGTPAARPAPSRGADSAIAQPEKSEARQPRTEPRRQATTAATTTPNRAVARNTHKADPPATVTTACVDCDHESGLRPDRTGNGSSVVGHNSKPGGDDWILLPSIPGALAATGCTALGTNLTLARSAAIARARAELSRIIETRVATFDETIEAQIDGDGGPRVTSSFRSISRQVSTQALSRSQPLRIESVSDGAGKRLCALVAIDGAGLQSSAREATALAMDIPSEDIVQRLAWSLQGSRP